MPAITLRASALRIVHVCECVFLTVLAVRALGVLTPAILEHPQVVFFLTAELVSVVLVLIQRPGDVAVGIRPLIFGFAGSCIALLVRQAGAQLAPDLVTTVLLCGGLTISISAKLCLARSFGVVPANRGVRTIGLYRLVRHPMYLGYMINHVGFLLIFPGLWNVAIVALAWSLLWVRIGEEEKVLMRDPAYREYASRVRARLVPGLL